MFSRLNQYKVLTCLSDHQLVRSKMSLRVTPQIYRRRGLPQCKLHTLLLNDVSIQKKLSAKIENANLPVEMDNLDEETAWKQFKDTTYIIRADFLGFLFNISIKIGLMKNDRDLQTTEKNAQFP